MRRPLFRTVLVLILAAAAAAAGFVSWKVTAPAQRLCRFLNSRRTGWQISLQEAIWIPWRSLELADLQVRTPQGGRLHLVRVRFWPQIWTLVRGEWETRWEFEEIRLDPRSWGIRRPLVQEVLSAGPVTKDGLMILRFGWEKLTLQQLVLQGPLLRLRAQGWLIERTRQAGLALRGELSRDLLEGMKLAEPGQSPLKLWEPFELRVAGSLRAPEIRFASSFLTFAMTPQFERRS